MWISLYGARRDAALDERVYHGSAEMCSDHPVSGGILKIWSLGDKGWNPRKSEPCADSLGS